MSRSRLIAASVSFLFAAAAFGSESGAPLRKRLQAGDQAFELVRLASKHLLISESCVSPGDGAVRECAAFRAAKRASFRKFKISRFGGAEPGALLCGELGGKHLEARDADGNDHGLCRFGDGSVVSTDSLHYYAVKNDE